MSSKLKIHLEAYRQGKDYAVKVVKVLTGSTKKDAEELIKKAPVDFEVSGHPETIRAILREAGVVGTVTDSSGVRMPIQDSDSVPGETETGQGGKPSGTSGGSSKKKQYMTLYVPSLANKRTDAVLVLQDVLGIERWEAEIYVDRTPLQLTFDKKDRADLLTSKLGKLGFVVQATVAPVYYDQSLAKKTENDIQGKKDEANNAIEAIRDSYNQIVPLVTLSKLVSDLVVKETSINLETAENNYQKLQSILTIAVDQQNKASAILKELLSIKDKAYVQLVDAQSNGAIDAPVFARLEDLVNQVAALYEDGKNLCNRLIKNAISALNGYVKTAGDALVNAKDIEKKGSDLMEKYSGEAIYEGLTALSEINFALPLPHTIRGTVYRRSKFDPDTVHVPLVGVLVELSGIVSPDADKTEADENPSCYTDSNGNFILVMPERYSLKETLRIIVSQGANRQVFLKSATEILYSVPEQALLDQFIEVDNQGRELVNQKTNLSELQADYDEFRSYKAKLDIRMSILISQREENGNGLNIRLDPKVLEYIESMNINLGEAKDQIEREIVDLDVKIGKVERSANEVYKKITDLGGLIGEYESRYSSQLSSLLFGLKAQKNLSFPESTPLDKIFDAFLAKTTAPEAVLEGTDLLKDEYEGLVVIDEVFQGDYADASKALPSVKLMENEGREIRLPSDTAPSRVFGYSMLQRLVEPKLTQISNSGKRIEVTRKTMADPVDVKAFKESMTKNPDTYPQMSTLGMGYVLNMHQAWIPDGFALGSLLYSLILAPGEEQRLIVRENKQSYLMSDMAEGSDLVSEDYQMGQDDDSTAVYNYALNQLSTASSHSSYRTSTWGAGGAGGFGGIGNGIAGMLGLSGSYSRSSGDATSSSRQSNTHNEASTAAQSFHHSIKSASDKIAQSKRISVSTATSEVSESVATKIIANHNHSHALTIQYWEVMRRYRLETCVEGVNLVLFVPMKLIRFLPDDKNQFLQIGGNANFKKTDFEKRYEVLLKYAQTLQYALPYKYRQGLKLIQYYSALPSWVLEKASDELTSLTFSVKVSLLSCDKLTATLYLKNGKGSISATMNATKGQPKDVSSMDEKYMKSADLLRALSDEREKDPTVVMSCSFNLPDDVFEDDLSYIRLSYSCENTSIPLRFGDLDPEITMSGKVKGMKSESDYVDMGLGINQAQAKAIIEMADAYYDYIKNNRGSSEDLWDYRHYRQAVPECLSAYPARKYVELNNSTIRKIESPRISSPTLSRNGVTITLPSDRLTSGMRVSLSTEVKTLRNAELRKIEETFMHVISETMHYSQMIWSDLSADERAMMLEKYTIDMDFSSINDSLSFGDDDGIKQSGKITIPLLNCVNVKKVMGFYGNCILLPFTYPSSLARKLGKTAGEIQDALYRYHTSSFRAPTTTISLPTSGMVGEAVLGETNVSEKIDITRFWNWQDSPIDKMTLDQNYLNGKDYLAEKSTQDITALGLQGAAAATPVTNVDLISALIKKEVPTFDNITGLDQLKEILNAGTASAAAGRDSYLKEASAMAGKALDAAAASQKKSNNQQQQPGGDTNNQNPQGGPNTQNPQGGPNGKGGQGGPNGQGGGGNGPSASFTATLTFNTGNMNGKTTATAGSPQPAAPAPEDQQPAAPAPEDQQQPTQDTPEAPAPKPRKSK